MGSLAGAYGGQGSGEGGEGWLGGGWQGDMGGGVVLGKTAAGKSDAPSAVSTCGLPNKLAKLAPHYQP